MNESEIKHLRVNNDLRDSIDYLLKVSKSDPVAVASIQTVLDHIRGQSVTINTDVLTKIRNRTGFINGAVEMIEAEKQRSPKGTAYLAIYFDLDNFKTINDKLSHEAGDMGLALFASLLNEAVKKDKDFVSVDSEGVEGLPARDGGDEFKVVIPIPLSDSDSKETIEALCERVKERIRSRLEKGLGAHYFSLNQEGKAVVQKANSQNSFQLGVSMGHSVYIDDNEYSHTGEVLEGIKSALKKADINVKEDKLGRKKREKFINDMSQGEDHY